MLTDWEPIWGKTANAKTRIPIPPMRCVKLRQNKLECANASTSVKILEPVVVNPLVVSKNASTKRGMSPLITKGIPPNKENNTHDKATITKPSRAVIRLFFGFFSEKTVPITVKIILTDKKLKVYRKDSL